MKKYLILLAVTLLVGCGQSNPISSDNVKSYSNEKLGISFDYPADWTVDDKDNASKIYIHSTNGGTQVTIPDENFEEFENRNSEYLKDNYFDILSEENKYPTDFSKNYTVKGYSSHEGVHYILEKDGIYLSITTDEYYLPITDNKFDAQKENFKSKLDTILNSIKFNQTDQL